MLGDGYVYEIRNNTRNIFLYIYIYTRALVVLFSHIEMLYRKDLHELCLCLESTKRRSSVCLAEVSV